MHACADDQSGCPRHRRPDRSVPNQLHLPANRASKRTSKSICAVSKWRGSLATGWWRPPGGPSGASRDASGCAALCDRVLLVNLAHTVS